MSNFPISDNFKNRKVKVFFKEEIEPHEILLDKLAKAREEELGISEKKSEVPLLQKIFQKLLIFSLFLALLLFARTFQFQVLEHRELTALVERNRYALKAIQAERGVIYDRNLKQLVFNRSRFDLVLERANFPQKEKERKKVLKEVSQILELNLEDLERKIAEFAELRSSSKSETGDEAKPQRPSHTLRSARASEASQVLIAQNLDHQTLIILKTRAAKLPGFQIINTPIRKYREGRKFGHIIGYTGRVGPEELRKQPQFYSPTDYVGRAGLEKVYEEVLRRTPGRMKIKRDAVGRIISKEIIQLPQPGRSLVLSLDSELQKKTREVLERQRQALDARGGAAVALDPRTGEVLTLVSLPDFDNNLFQKGADPEKLQELLEDPFKLTPLFNRAISGRGYLTGSTIKPLIALAALEEEIISPEKQIFSGGFIAVPDRYNPGQVFIFRDWRVHGWTDMKKAIAQSVNIYFYAIGGGYGGQVGLGSTRIRSYLELFGWGRPSGIDLPNEGAGLVPCPEWKREFFKRREDQIWHLGNTYLLSIGQEFVSATPLQVSLAISAIANGGKLFQPQLVKSIVDVSGGSLEIVEEIEPKIIREDFINPKNLQVIREGMRQTVTQGTARGWLNLLPVASAAKTGSAQTGRFDKEGNELLHNWITVFAPYEDPEIVLTVMLEDVPGTMAGPLPVVKEILEWYFTR